MIPHYPHQITGFNFARANKKVLLAWHMRLGKSRTALEVAREDQRILIVTPTLGKISWQRQIEFWLSESEDISFQLIDTLKTKVDLSKRIHIVPHSIIHHIMTRGGLPKPQHFILDEVHYCKEPLTKRSLAGMRLLRDSDTAVMLSGTPLPNRPSELWPILFALRIFKDQQHFESRFCSGWNAPWGWDTRGASNLPELSEHLKDFMYSVGKDKVDGMPDLLPPKVIELDMPVDKREIAFNRDAIVLNPHPIAFEGLTEVMKTSAMRKVPLALDHIADCMATMGPMSKVLVWFWFRDVGRLLEQELQAGNPIGGLYQVHRPALQTAYVDGSVSKRQEEIDRFNTDPHCRVFIGQIKSAGEVVDIVGGYHNIFVEAPWPPGWLHQAQSRAWGPNQKAHHVSTDILTIHNSIDSIVLHSLLHKQEDVIEPLLKPTENPKMTNQTDIAIRTLIEGAANTSKVTVRGYILALMPESFPELTPEPIALVVANTPAPVAGGPQIGKIVSNTPQPAPVIAPVVIPGPVVTGKQISGIPQPAVNQTGPADRSVGSAAGPVGLLNQPVSQPDVLTTAIVPEPAPGVGEKIDSLALQSASDITIDQVRDTMRQVVTTVPEGEAVIAALFAKLGVRTITELDPAVYSQVVETGAKLVAEHATKTDSVQTPGLLG